MSLDDQHLITVGGNEGPHTPNTPGTHSKVVHIDATPMNGNATTGHPLITVLPSRLLYAVQSPVVALEVSDTEIVVFGGATYPNTWASFPVTYVPYVQELTLLNHANVLAGRGNAVGASGGSGLTGGQIAAIVICVLLFVCMATVIAYLLWTRKRRGGLEKGMFTAPSKHADGHIVEMGNNAAMRLEEQE